MSNLGEHPVPGESASLDDAMKFEQLRQPRPQTNREIWEMMADFANKHAQSQSAEVQRLQDALQRIAVEAEHGMSKFTLLSQTEHLRVIRIIADKVKAEAALAEPQETRKP